MKKLSLIVATTAIAATTLTGCMKETSTLQITKAQKVTGELRFMIDNDFVDMMQMFDEETPGAQDMSRKKYLSTMMEADTEITDEMPKGLDFKVVTAKNFSGWAFTFDKASFKTINRIGREMADSRTKPLIRIATNSKKQVVLKYRITGMDGTDDVETTDAEMPAAMKPRYKVSATLPGKILSTNGKVKKRTVTWSGVTPAKDKVLTATSRPR